MMTNLNPNLTLNLNPNTIRMTQITVDCVLMNIIR